MVWITPAISHITTRMKRYVGLIVGFFAISVAAGWLVADRSAKVRVAERETAVQRLRADYLERVGIVRSNPDERVYKEEVNPFFRAYFNQVDDLLKKHGGNSDFDGYLQELEKRDAKGKGGGEGGRGDRKATYEAVRAVFDRMREGKYNPVFSATDKGLRLDVLSADATKGGGNPGIRYELVLWGASRELRDDGKNVKRMLTSASFTARWDLIDEKEKLFGKLEAPGDPSGKIDWPERYIPEFPPQMVLGHYDVDLVPDEVKSMEITFTVSSHAAVGGEVAATFVWKLETPGEWKMKPGEKWEGASESTATPEEIDRSVKK